MNIDTGTAAMIVAGLGLVLNLVVAAKSAQWGLPDRLSKMEGRIMGAVEGHRTAADQAIDKCRDEMVTRADTIRREFGETVSAMQSKISEFEKWTRDTFVRRDSFLTVTDEVKAALSERSVSVDSRFDRIENKIDKLTDHLLNNQ